MVPSEGFEDVLTGRFLLRLRPPQPRRPLSIGAAVAFDMEDFFKKQVEECRELERQAVTADDRAFWRQAADRWQEQLRQTQTRTPKKAAPIRADKAAFKYTEA
jgi:hypothetical protein